MTNMASVEDLVRGLTARPRRLPAWLLYDEHGAALFEAIAACPEYYLTRSELALLQAHLAPLARTIGPGARVVEPGSGDGRKARLLLRALDAPRGYVPIDVSAAQLAEHTRRLTDEFPGLPVQPVVGDFATPVTLPPPPDDGRPGPVLVFFPGSTIGNFDPDDARQFLRRFGQLAGPGGLLLLGADANADPPSLLAAYDDSAGITAAFNRNVLVHLNRAYQGTFAPDRFAHRAVWNPGASRVEMHLVSRVAQAAQLGRHELRFAPGDVIVTEHCYKHRPQDLSALLANAGWRADPPIADADGRLHLWLARWVG